ncbi:MAG: diacylglycerol/lipid kinase family protein [Cyclobacteriaceae bacterium]
MNNYRCLFIINPISGLGQQKDLPELIHKHLDKSRFQYDIIITEYAGHGKKLAREMHREFDILVAVGGDGTINEIASGLIDSEAALGVIPLGSGNGFARHLKLSTQPLKAIQQLNRSQRAYMDTGLLNGHPFFNVSGTGFDGQISKIFAQQTKRGYLTYARLVMEELQNFQPYLYEFELDGKQYSEKFFLIAFANTSQYGNNAIIAADAMTDDGLLDIVMIRPFPHLHLPSFTMMAFFRRLHLSPYVKIVKAQQFRLKNPQGAPIHIDGEYLNQDKRIEIITRPNTLQVMIPLES